LTWVYIEFSILKILIFEIGNCPTEHSEGGKYLTIVFQFAVENLHTTYSFWQLTNC